MRMPKAFRRKAKAEIAIHILVSIIFAIIAASYLYTFLWAVIAGAKTHTEIILEPFGLPKIWNFQHYLEVFSTLNVNGTGFGGMLFNSVYFSVGDALIAQFFTMSFAYVCTKYKFPGSEFPYTIIMIMLTLPLYGSGAAAYRLNESLGMIDSYARLIMSIGGMGMGFLYYRAYYQNVSWSYAEAAMIDGANDFQIYFKIMFPMGKPIFGALFLTSWLQQWNAYEGALLYIPNLPTLPVGIYQFNTEMIYRARLDILFAACVLISIPALVLFATFNKVITTNVSVGGIKG